MAQFDILELIFDLPQTDDQPAELTVLIDNPQHMEVDEVQPGVVPDDVQIIQPGEEPTEEFWVYADSHHLTITLTSGAGENPLPVPNTGFYNRGDNEKYLDIVVAEKNGDNTKTTKKARRKQIIVRD